MTQMRLPRPSVAVEDLEQDDFTAEYFRWPRTERTCAAIAGTVDEVARIPVHVARTTPAAYWTRVLPVVEQFVTSATVLHLDDADFVGELARLTVASPSTLLGEMSETDLGAPRVDVLLDAVADLTAWTGMTKQNLSKYLGVSYSTVLSWRRERPSQPRHRSIPTLLALWSAVSGAREQFGSEEAARLVWAAGATDVGAPAIPADELANWLVEETSEGSLADFLEDDGYTPGAAHLPDVEELARAEGRLHAILEETHARSDDTTGR